MNDAILCKLSLYEMLILLMSNLLFPVLPKNSEAKTTWVIPERAWRWKGPSPRPLRAGVEGEVKAGAWGRAESPSLRHHNMPT
jgi:hypothetical protein